MTTAVPRTEASKVSAQSHWDETALRDRCLGNLKLINQVLQRFLATLEREIVEMQRAWEAGEIEKLAANAHRLKGTAATVGAVQLEAISQEIESLGRSGRRDQLEVWLSQLAAEQRYLAELFMNYYTSSSP